jgi:uncharacterized protein (TIGR00255 family)
MLQGMTGFGTSEQGDFRVEVRSLNHRYLDVHVRLPQGVSAEHELRVRQMVRELFSRGRFDIYITLRPGRQGLQLEPTAAKEVYEALSQLSSELGLAGPVGLAELLRLKEFFIQERTELYTEALYGALKEALQGVLQMRLREGQAIQEDILQRLQGLEGLLRAMRERLPRALQDIRERLGERLRHLCQEQPLEEARLAQEAALLAEGADITEELVRLQAHLQRMRKILSSDDTIGRQLDFILQELHREANTIGAKSQDMEIIERVIEFKTEVERMRQQVQNLQ